MWLASTLEITTVLVWFYWFIQLFEIEKYADSEMLGALHLSKSEMR